MKKLNTIFEDSEILVVEKPAGVVVNRSETIREETLQDQIGEYLGLADGGIGDRAGIVHRLDRETSGLLVVAKTQESFGNLQAQFKQRTVKKEYIALVHGKIKDSQGIVESAIGRLDKFGKFGVVSGGRESRTDFEVVNYYSFGKEIFRPRLHLDEGVTLTKSRLNYLKNHAMDYTLLRLLPKTGRTHQIRVHVKSIGHPIVSDLIYAPRKLVKFDLIWCPRLFLHAKALEFDHPTTSDKLTFKSDLPSDLKKALNNLTIDH